jgi:hypothetical protein
MDLLSCWLKVLTAENIDAVITSVFTSVIIILSMLKCLLRNRTVHIIVTNGCDIDASEIRASLFLVSFHFHSCLLFFYYSYAFFLLLLPFHWYSCHPQFNHSLLYYTDLIQSYRLFGLAVRVRGYRYRRDGFDSRRYKSFWEVVGLERRPLRLVRITEELF